MFNPIIMWFLLSLMSAVGLWLISSTFFSIDSSINSNEPFECGMEMNSATRVPMNMQFYVISILFLIFDIELILSIPLIMSEINKIMWMVFMTMFSLILFLGLCMEISIGTLDWKKELT